MSEVINYIRTNIRRRNIKSVLSALTTNTGTIVLPSQTNLDGGSANSTYLVSQSIDGGSA